MIEAKELRFGNIVYVDNEKYKIVGIYENRIKTKRYDQISYFPFYHIYLDEKFLKPIQLTKDLLMNCGFKLETNKPNQYRYKNRLIIVRDAFFVDYGTSVRIKYLHKLQNFIYALNNEELEINL